MDFRDSWLQRCLSNGLRYLPNTGLLSSAQTLSTPFAKQVTPFGHREALKYLCILSSSLPSCDVCPPGLSEQLLSVLHESLQRWRLCLSEILSRINNPISFTNSSHEKASCYLITQSYLTLCNPKDCSMPGFPVLHYSPEFAQSCPFSW